MSDEMTPPLGGNRPMNSLEEQREAVLAIAGQEADLCALLAQAEELRLAIPSYTFEVEVNSYRFARGGNLEARL